MQTDLRQTLHRGAKALMDSGEAASVEEALATLQTYRMAVAVGDEVATSAAHQAALLTIVNAGSRTLLGGVNVIRCPDAPLRTTLPGGPGLREAVRFWGGRHMAQADLAAPTVVLGTPSATLPIGEIAIRASFSGWNGGIAPLREGWRLDEQSDFPPVGVLTGALAVGECFQRLRGKNPMAMRRRAGLSLWQPDRLDGWENVKAPSLGDLGLPQKLWVIGLGHLGQAYLWTLITLPYAEPERMTLVLQDFDILSRANLSTSLLTHDENIGEKKTRRMAHVCEARGFQTILIERCFDASFQVTGEDPLLALCGVDNSEARRQLECPGFAEIIEAGLGHEAEEYLGFGMHGFPGSRTAGEVWKSAPLRSTESLLAQPAYHQLREGGVDSCGLVQVAGATVGVPFVGAFVSCLVLAEAVRAVSGERRYETMGGSLRNLERRTCYVRTAHPARNLGYLRSTAD